MSIFGNIMKKIFHHPAAAATPGQAQAPRLDANGEYGRRYPRAAADGQ